MRHALSTKESMNEENSMDVGVQPLDALMEQHSLSNHDLVAAMPPGYVTHKQIQKARKGRRLTPHLQDKVLKALNACLDDDFSIGDVFNYRGKKSI